jgi:hypothetical protein
MESWEAPPLASLALPGAPASLPVTGDPGASSFSPASWVGGDVPDDDPDDEPEGAGGGAEEPPESGAGFDVPTPPAGP